MKNVLDKEFKSFGKVLKGFDFEKFVNNFSQNFTITIPEKGNEYIGSVPEIEETEVFSWLKDSVYGGLEIQLGTCAGHNQVTTAIEFHQGSEVVIALTDCILELGQVSDIIDNTYNANLMSTFKLEKGQAVELFGTTLHYSPIKTTKDGYVTLVALLKGTNESTSNSKNPLILAKNKFMLVHSSRIDKIENGAIPGFINDKI